MSHEDVAKPSALIGWLSMFMGVALLASARS